MAHTRTAAAPTRAAAPAPTLDDRLALTGLAMDTRLDRAGIRVSVATAHIDIPEPEIGYIAHHDTPIADLLHRARHRLATAGWSRHTAIDGTGAMCPLHAIHLEARNAREEGEARSLLLQAIQAERPDVCSIPRWNSQQTGPAPALRMLGAAAGLATSRGL
ncbi:hypothetical protein [Streptomyces sp. NPDC012888]|uniref:DUF6197 family protein n=1 Tax=Streptomyces sp. NPDC012888 TaxID=3364855 RepID=UPI0036891210